MKESLDQLSQLISQLQKDEGISLLIEEVSRDLSECLQKGGKILIAGNGGSAAEAQHFAAELIGRYKTERRGYPAIALTTDTSILTAVGNDYSFNDIFSRQVAALGGPKDIFFGLSTSGNSPNIRSAVAAARAAGMKTIALLGKDGGALKEEVDSAIVVPSSDTPRIQEIHLHIIHELCAYFDAYVAGQS